MHLAAQAGVRHSLVDPYAYVQSNVMGHLVVQEVARRLPALRHLVYASSSSVYGLNQQMPFRETDRVDTPVSLYAATKRADELMAHAYAHLFGLPQTGLRFFTVYGPWGRPDMAYYSFARAIMAGEPITLFEDGRLRRDFTYIDDIVAGVVGCIDRPPDGGLPARVLNIGNNQPEEVRTLVALLEQGLGRRAVTRSAPRPGGGRGGDLCRCLRDRRADRLRAAYQPGGGDRAICGLVPGVPRAGGGAANFLKNTRLTGAREWPKSPFTAADEKRLLLRSGFATLSGLHRKGATQSKMAGWPVGITGRWAFLLRSLTGE